MGLHHELPKKMVDDAKKEAKKLGVKLPGLAPSQNDLEKTPDKKRRRKSTPGENRTPEQGEKKNGKRTPEKGAPASRVDGCRPVNFGQPPPKDSVLKAPTKRPADTEPAEANAEEDAETEGKTTHGKAAKKPRKKEPGDDLEIDSEDVEDRESTGSNQNVLIKPMEKWMPCGHVASVCKCMLFSHTVATIMFFPMPHVLAHFILAGLQQRAWDQPQTPFTDFPQEASEHRGAEDLCGADLLSKHWVELACFSKHSLQALWLQLHGRDEPPTDFQIFLASEHAERILCLDFAKKVHRRRSLNRDFKQKKISMEQGFFHGSEGCVEAGMDHSEYQ